MNHKWESFDYLGAVAAFAKHLDAYEHGPPIQPIMIVRVDAGTRVHHHAYTAALIYRNGN